MTQTLAAATAAMVTGLRGLTGLSTGTVTDRDWLATNNAAAVFVLPSGSGQQTYDAVDSWSALHRIPVELWLKNDGNVQRLYTDAQTLIDTILAWLRTAAPLGTAGAIDPGEPVTYTAQDIRNEANGIDYRLVTFTVPVYLSW